MATVSGAQIAAAGRRYNGQGYVYGGNASRPGDWDCSSFVSYVLGHDLGLGLPGGRWGGPGMPPAVHGPVVLSYVTWGGADPVPAGQETAGDLACFAGLGAGGHMGIVLGPNQMVSALDSAQGTTITPVAGYGPAGAPLVYRRVKGTGAAPVPATDAAAAGGLVGSVLVPMLVGAVAAAGIMVGVVALAAAVGLGIMWALARAGQEVAG
jgi:NlpC/P60 family